MMRAELKWDEWKAWANLHYRTHIPWWRVVYLCYRVPGPFGGVWVVSGPRAVR